jgi:hypothetical protein
MAKKNKTKSKSAPKLAPPTVDVPEKVEEVVSPATTEPRAPRAPKLSRSQAAAERIEDEYAHITSDLRRVFMVAGLIFALLIALNLMLRAMG